MGLTFEARHAGINAAANALAARSSAAMISNVFNGRLPMETEASGGRHVNHDRLFDRRAFAFEFFAEATGEVLEDGGQFLAVDIG